MKNFSIFPAFIEQIESRLIIHNPWLWSTRIVRHLWLLLIFNIILAIGAFVTPINFQNLANPESWFLFMILFLVVYGIYWVYQQVIHNIERDGGSKALWLTIPDLLIKWVGFFLLLSIPFTPSYILSRKIDASISDQNFENETQLIYASDALVGERDDFQFFVSDSAFLNRNNPKNRYVGANDGYYEDDIYYKQASYESNYKVNLVNILFWKAIGRIQHFNADIYNDMYTESQKIDSIEHYEYVRDSIIRHFDTYFVGGTDHYVSEGGNMFFNRDSLFIVCRDLTDSELEEMYLDRKAIHIKYGSDYENTATEAVHRFRRLVKGNVQQGEVNEYVSLNNLRYDDRNSSNQSYQNRRLVGKVKDGKLNLLNAEMYLFLAIFFFGLAILLWVFRSIHWKWFILSVAVAVGLFVLSGMLIEWLDYRDSVSVFAALFVNFALVSAVILFKLSGKRFSRLMTVCLALFISFLAFMPGIVMKYMDKELDYFNREQFYLQIDELEQKVSRGEIDSLEYDKLLMEINIKRDKCFAEIDSIVFNVFLAGLLLFLLLSPALQKILNEQRSLPVPK